jgi:hypothetical protein
MGTHFALFLADLFLYSYQADFIQGLLKKSEKKLGQYFNLTFRYIDDVISLAQDISIYIGHFFYEAIHLTCPSA